MARKPIAGTVFLKVDGDQLSLRGNLTISIDSIEREGIAGQDQVHGFKEMPRVPFIEGDFSDAAELSLEAIRKQADVTVQAELANGKQYLLRNAWTASARELDTAEGQVQIRWEGQSGEEILSTA